jgi:hypothetical protein
LPKRKPRVKHLPQPRPRTKRAKVRWRDSTEHVKEQNNKRRITQAHAHDECPNHASDDPALGQKGPQSRGRYVDIRQEIGTQGEPDEEYIYKATVCSLLKRNRGDASQFDTPVCDSGEPFFRHAGYFALRFGGGDVDLVLGVFGIHFGGLYTVGLVVIA